MCFPVAEAPVVRGDVIVDEDDLVLPVW